MRQFQCVPTTNDPENKEENYLELYIFQVSCSFFLPLENPKLPISIKIPVTLYCKMVYA